jgi:hypothetical protein
MPHALAAIALAAVLAATTAVAGGGSPSLRLVRAAPLTVHGTGFGARERVRVTFHGRSVAVRRTAAGAGGGFTVSYGDVLVSRCDGFRVVATGARGNSAVLRRPPLPGCHTG